MYIPATTGFLQKVSPWPSLHRKQVGIWRTSPSPDCSEPWSNWTCQPGAGWVFFALTQPRILSAWIQPFWFQLTSIYAYQSFGEGWLVKLITQRPHIAPLFKWALESWGSCFLLCLASLWWVVLRAQLISARDTVPGRGETRQNGIFRNPNILKKFWQTNLDRKHPTLSSLGLLLSSNQPSNPLNRPHL